MKTGRPRNLDEIILGSLTKPEVIKKTEEDFEDRWLLILDTILRIEPLVYYLPIILVIGW